MKEIRTSIDIHPVGYVECMEADTSNMNLNGVESKIHIYPEFKEALRCVEDHQYMWVLSWFHEAPRNVLQVSPSRVNPDIEPRGVFAIRSAVRPNPVALTLVEVVRVVDNTVYVTGYDAVDGTQIVDMKPYFEADCIFSARAPYIPRKDKGMQCEYRYKLALRHHGEDCKGLQLAVDKALEAEEVFGHLQAESLQVDVIGNACVGDVLQGLTRGRISNPPRFSYRWQEGPTTITWKQGEQILIQTVEV